MRRSALTVGCVLALTGSACTTTRALPSAGLAPLRAPGAEGPLEVVDAEGRRLRVDPNTQLRFALTNGAWTDWLRARRLRTSELGVRTDTHAWAWESIASAEVRNFSGPKTFGLVVVGAAAVTAIVALAIASDGDCCRGGGLVVAEAAVRGGQAAAVLASAEDNAERAPPLEGAVSRQAGHDAAPLFAGAIRRRSTVTVVPWIQTLGALQQGGVFEQSAGAAFRFMDVGEVGGYARATELPGRAGLHFIGGARAGLHLELDRHHRFSIPLLLELGGGPNVPVQGRLALGLRVRVVDGLRLGLIAPSPTFTRARRDDRTSTSGWTFPFGLEVGYAF